MSWDEQTKQRIIDAFDWMTIQLKYQFDSQKNALGQEGSEGGYSPELTDAIELLEELRKKD